MKLVELLTLVIKIFIKESYIYSSRPNPKMKLANLLNVQILNFFVMQHKYSLMITTTTSNWIVLFKSDVIQKRTFYNWSCSKDKMWLNHFDIMSIVLIRLMHGKIVESWWRVCNMFTWNDNWDNVGLMYMNNIWNRRRSPAHWVLQ